MTPTWFRSKVRCAVHASGLWSGTLLRRLDVLRPSSLLVPTETPRCPPCADAACQRAELFGKSAYRDLGLTAAEFRLTRHFGLIRVGPFEIVMICKTVFSHCNEIRLCRLRNTLLFRSNDHRAVCTRSTVAHAPNKNDRSFIHKCQYRVRIPSFVQHNGEYCLLFCSLESKDAAVPSFLVTPDGAVDRSCIGDVI